jgi:Cyclin, N-terminal domain
MELLPTWWLSPLAEDHHVWLRQKEVGSLPPYRSQSPQLEARLCLVDWLAVICDESKICLTGRHLAVLLLDYFMDNHHVDRSQLKLIALCSLHIAGFYHC